VIDLGNFEPIAKVNVEVNGGAYTTTNTAGEFEIRARVGDELTIRQAGFETVYHTITNDDDIRIVVKPEQDNTYGRRPKDRSDETKALNFGALMAKAEISYASDPKLGIEYVTEALTVGGKRGLTPLEYSKAYKLLGDIYMFWNQPDLAVTNYRLSLRNQASIVVQILLAGAYLESKNYQESITLFETLSTKKPTEQERITIYNGLGDAHTATGDLKKAEKAYRTALEIANRDASQRKAQTDLNARLASISALKGNEQEAEGFIDASLEAASTLDKKISSRAQVEAADLYSKNAQFDSEIELRKKALGDIEAINDSIPNAAPNTLQKQNYKIANAYVAKEDYDEAIPFFEKSISEASSKEDLAVEKDAQRKLSEVYKYRGEFNKAVEAYEKYVALVEKDYAQKEQEIQRATRLGQDLALKQNRISSLEKDRELNEQRYQVAFTEQELSQSRNNAQRLIIISLIIFSVLLSIAAVAIYRNFKQQKYANNLLALRGLRSQMNPHFIFNALNSVNSFIATSDERTANRYLSDFSSLMRSVLENSEEDFIPLSSEIELLEKYTMLEHFRFKDKFEYTFTVAPDLAVNDYQIPPMLLQPYVENAVWHGMRYREEKGTVRIDFNKGSEDTALITITDDGVGRTQSKALKTENQKKQKSKGMGNIKERIRILNDMYGDRIAVQIDDLNTDGTGTVVTLTLKKIA